MTTWDEIWERREPGTELTSPLKTLMELDGCDSGFRSVTEDDWLAGIRETADRLGLTPGDSVYEVGCGAGAFLFDLYRRGYKVGGLDRSTTLVEHARHAMPDGQFTRCDAADLDATESWDAVISFSAFEYFPSYEYARQVIEAIARKARKAVAVMDLPDLAVRDAAIAHRIELAGGEKAYAARYTGLDHLYYDRDWVIGLLAGCGLADVQTDSQRLGVWADAGFRFNAWGFRIRPGT